MLNKNIKYYNIIMKYDGQKKVGGKLPEKYYFDSYRKGDEFIWARMEKENNDFDSYENAVTYFQNKYLTNLPKLRERFIGIRRKDNNILVGCVICWDDIKSNDSKEKISTVHWLITDVREQGKGLGKALVDELIGKFSSLDLLPIYLHTQPWSFVAIGIYCNAGFKLCPKESFRNYENQSRTSLNVLKKLMKPNLYDKLITDILD